MGDQCNNISITEKKMEVGVPQSGEIIHVKLQRRMMYENSAFYAEQLQGFLLTTGGLYLVDLDSVERIDSTGLGGLINFARLVAKQSGRIAFVVNNPFLRELFLMAQFDKVFPVAETVEEGKGLLLGEFTAQIYLDQY